jgi:dTDP-4-amino-4,6-dideoxygalactose transaminase
MSFIAILLDVILHQLKNVIKFFLGFPLVTPPLTSTTLDIDDVILAEEWLNKKENWLHTKEAIEFNLQFAQWNGSKYAFSFMGVRVALSAIIHALDLKPGDQVIIPGYTCIVVPNAFHFAISNDLL